MTSRKYRAVLLFGAPGVGKGTQGRILGQIPGFFHLSCGDVFRSIDIGSPEGKEVYQYISRGELAPDDLTIRIWNKGLDGQIALSGYKPREDLLVLDGIPRSVRQAELLDGHVSVLRVVHLVCPDEEAMIHRIRRRAIRENRTDDANEKIIRHRFDVYRRESAPVLDYYPQEIVSQVDAIGSPAEVLRTILDCLIPVQNEHFRSQFE
jgi:adenylate kinase